MMTSSTNPQSHLNIDRAEVRRPSSTNTGREERLDTGIDFKVSLS